MATTRRPELTRRTFLSLSGAGVGALALADLLAGCRRLELGAAAEAVQIDVSGLVIRDWITVRRPDDLLVLDIGLVNLVAVDQGGARVLVKKKAAQPALLVVMLPSQHLAEPTVPSPPPIVPTEHLRADGSRLVFNVGALVPIPVTIAGLLDACSRTGLNVALGAAAPPGVPEIGGSTSGLDGARLPDALETALELPTRLALSPSQAVRFAHALAPVTSARGRSELWHTRLDAPPDLRTMRALHHFAAPDPVPGGVPDGPIRDAIVELSTSPGSPIVVERLALSALGAWFDGSLDNTLGVPGLLHWEQRIAMGRDARVEVVLDGTLWPLPHRASMVVTVERRTSGGPDPVAYLHRAVTAICTEPERRYHGTLPPLVAARERGWPFASMRIITRVTPPLDGAPPPTASITPTVGGEPFGWEIEAIDRRGERVRFTMPLVWVPAGQPGPSPAVVLDPVVLAGQRIAFAPFVDGGELGDREATTYETRTLTVVGEPVDVLAGWDAPWYPAVEGAELVVEALAAVAGATSPVAVRFAPAYLAHGLDSPAGNQHDLVLELVGGALRADFVKAGTDKVGGFAAPNLEVAGLARGSGPVTPAMVAAPAADLAAAAVFPLPLGGALDAFCPRLFGCVSLLDLLDRTVGLKPEDLVPRFVTEAFDQIQRLRQAVDTLIARAGQLVTQLDDVVQRTQSTAADIYQHALAIKAFFDANHADYVIQLALDAQRELRALVETLDPATVTEAQIDAALQLGLVERVQRLGRTIASDRTVKLIEYVPDGGTLLRTLRRLLTGVADVAEVADQILAVLRATLKGLVKARDVARDKRVKLDWRPKLTPRLIVPGVDLAFRKLDGLLLSVELRAQQRGAQKAGADVLCSLVDFDLELLSILRLRFKRLQFRQRMGQKPEIDVVFGGIDFIGKLAFVETLKQILPTDGFSDPPAVKVDARGLDASFSLDVPNLAVGVFSLEHMRIGARLVVPFLGDAISFRFEYSRREAPFLVTVAMLGGGGFLELELTPKGMRSLVASIQFGAQLSASIGVASGSISFMGGFVYEMTGTDVALTGFLRVRGECDILGLVSASIELYLDLKYRSGKLTGTATLSIEISVACFTLPVTLTTTRTFAGAAGDPPLAEVVAAEDFAEYCRAFAA